MNQGPGSINRVYRLVWREALGAYVVVAETTKARGKRASGVVGAVTVASLLALVQPAIAGPPAPTELPTGATVTAGQAQIGQSGSRMDINQGSQRAVINWQTFNVGGQAQVNFNQPNASSVALNRVLSADPSAIFGKLTANGQVILVNPNGIVFGAGSRVDVGGLVASTLNIADADFMAGRLRFTRGDATGSVVNQGEITAADGGYVALLAPEARNEGVISARLGTVAMAAGDAVTLDISGTGALSVKVDPATISALVENRSMIQADGGTVIMSAGAAQRLLEQAVAGSSGATALVSDGGHVRLVSMGGTVSARGGQVKVEGATADVSGAADVGGVQAGHIDVTADFVSQTGSLRADATLGQGGQVHVDGGTVIQTASAILSADGASGGGAVRVDGQSRVYTSATMQARGTGAGASGGDIAVAGASVQLRAALADASGAGAGGRIRIGGGLQGQDTDIDNAQDVGINGTTVLKADAGASGQGGTVAVWSDGSTVFAGSIFARGGAQSGNGGRAEVSGKASLAYAGQVNLSASHGSNGQLLLDPRNIIIDNAASAIASLNMSDPTASTSNGFGTVTQALSNNNVVITAPNADTGSTTATGAVYLFNSATGALLGDLRGSNSGDKIGSEGIHVLSNGNYLVLSPSYGTQTGKDYFSRSTSDGASGVYAIVHGTVSAGAITWQSGSGSNGGASSFVSSSNSLVGSTSNTDSRTYYTYSGTTVTNSGTKTVTANDRIGQVDEYDATYSTQLYATTQIYDLGNGNVAIATPYWYNGRGAVTWMNGSTGALTTSAAGAAISSSVSLIGNTGMLSLANLETDSGSKTAYVTGLNQIAYGFYNTNNTTSMRTTAPGALGDTVGQTVQVLGNGSYVVESPLWTNGSATYAGAVTFAGTSGLAGTVSSSNSLVGSNKYDYVGSGGVVAVGSSLANYVVMSPYWADSGNAAKGKYFANQANGAVTWISGSTGDIYGTSSTGGAVSSTNSFIGAAGDMVGSLNNAGNNPYVGYNAATSTYTTSTDSRYGAGSIGVTVLKNGNYLIEDTSSGSSKGSVTFASGNAGIAGTLSSSNSLVGVTSGDRVGTSLTELSGSNYVVYESTWTNPTGTKANAGAVTWGSGTSGVTGTVSSSNSLVGTDAYDQVSLGGVRGVGTVDGHGLSADFIVLSPEWGNRSSNQYVTNAYGAVTWVDGSNGHPYGVSGTGAAVSSSNSLVGSTGGDYVGSYHGADTRSTGYVSSGNYAVYSTWYAVLTPTVDVLANGDYVVRSASWGSGKGAATWAAGGTGVAGTISSGNSLVGSTADVYATSTATNQSRYGNNYTDTTTYQTTMGDHVGLLGQALPNSSYELISPFWGNGRGALTWVASSSHTGTVGGGNSLVGSTQDVYSNASHASLVSAGDRLGVVSDLTYAAPVVSDYTSSGTTYTTTLYRPTGLYQLATPADMTDASSHVLGKTYYPIAPRNNAPVPDGYGDTNTSFAFNAIPDTKILANGNLLIASTGWNNTSAANAGAITWINASNGQLADGSSSGTLSATNSLVGSHAGDRLGLYLPVGGATELSNGNFVLSNPQWYSERGAITWGSGTAGVAGTVSSSNSLVGTTASGSISQVISGVYVPASGTYNPSRYVDGQGWVLDWVIELSNGQGDRVGQGGIFALGDGNAAVGSPFWNSTTTYSGSGAPSSYGAVSWINGSNGHLADGSTGGSVSATNSLVGSHAGDAVSFQSWDQSGVSYTMPGITVLSGGRYVVASPYWSDGTNTGVGAVTFNPAGGLVGAVSTSNSLTGSTAGDHVGRGFTNYSSVDYAYTMMSAVEVLSNGSFTNYLVRSPDWTNTTDTAGGGAGAGAFTWVDGSTGYAYGDSSRGATVSAHNSIVGNVAGDGVGTLSIVLKHTVSGVSTSTGDALLLSNVADCVSQQGAITLMPGATGMAGPVSWRNSIIGYASPNNGMDTSTPDGSGNFLSDIHYSILSTAVTGSETVQYRPLIWAAPNYTSGLNVSSAMVLTTVSESTAASTTASLVNTGGNANWSSDLFAGNTSNFTALGGNAGTGLLGFSSNTGGNLVITPAMITSLLNGGTNVTLQANNDISVLRDITVSASGLGGDLTLEAGRSIKVMANITTDNGDFTAKANQTVANGVVNSDCSSCVAELTMLAGTTINAGTGAVSLSMMKSTDKTTNTGSRMQVANVLGGDITLSNGAVDGSGNGVGIGFVDGSTIGNSGTHSLTLLGSGGSNHSGGIAIPTNVSLVAAADAALVVGAADAAATVNFGGATSGGFYMSATEMGAIIQHSQGFGQVVFGRADQTGQTTVGSVDFTSASLQRNGSSSLAADVKLQGGSGGVSVTGTLKSGVDSNHTFELAATGGTVSLGSSSSLTAATGVLKLSANGGSGAVTQASGATLNASQLLLAGAGSVDLSAGTSNTIGTLAGNVGTAHVRTTSGNLTVGTVGGVDGLTGSTGLRVQASGATSDVVLNKALTNSTGTINVAAGCNFVNNTTTDTGLAPGSGRYLVYSTNPTASTEGMSSYNKHYNQTYNASSTPGYASSGNWFLYSVAPSLSASVSGGSTVVYGSSASAPGVNVTGFIDGDTLQTATTGSLSTSFSSYTPSSAGFIPVGTYTVSLNGIGTLASSLGYTINVTTGSSSLTVQAKALNASGLSANSKVYDGTTAAVLSGTASLTGGGSTSSDGQYMAGDVVSISGTATGAFADKNQGTGKSVTLSGLTLSGADAGNYTISANSVTADISRKTITVSGLSTASTKVYDGTTTATVLGTAALLASETAGSGGSSDGKRYTGDTVSLSGTATGSYNSKDVASASTVSFGGLSLTGADAGNYTLSAGSTAATITAKALSTSGLSVASSKVYDGTTTATVLGTAALLASETAGSGSTSDGKRYSGDTVSLSGTATGTYNSKNVASASTVSFGGLSLTGADAGNYSLTQGSTAATITAKTIGVSGLSVASSKVYDGTTTATVLGSAALLASEATGSGSSSDGLRYTGDTVSLSGTASATYNSKDVASASTVSFAGLSLTGADAGNYSLNAGSTAATITAKALTMTGLSVASSRSYDGTTGATVLGSASLLASEATGSGSSSDGLRYSGDTVTLSGTATGTYNSKDVASASTVTIAGLSLAGAQASNYTLTPISQAATITAKSLSVQGLVAVGKTYDGLATAALTGTAALQGNGSGGSDGHVLTGDSVSLQGTAVATFSNGHAGQNKTVTITGLSLAGTDAANYSLAPLSTTASIATRGITVTADDQSKVYGGADPTLSYQVGGLGLASGDTLGSVFSGALTTTTGASATAGTHAITQGTLAANSDYAISTFTAGTLTVSKAALTVQADDKSKVYGNTDPALTYTVDTTQLKYTDTASVVSGASLQTATGAAATAGTHAITITGATAANYTITPVSGTLTVSKANLTVTADDQSKVYGDADPSLTFHVDSSQLKYTDTAAVVTGLGLSTATGASATAGSHVITASGGSADNYTLAYVNGSLSVSKAALTVTADDQAKVYGHADPTLTYTVNPSQLKYTDTASVVSGLTLSTATGASATAGQHVITLQGGLADNYDVTTVNGALTVSKAHLTVTADDKSKTVGEADPTLTYTVDSSQLRYTDSASVVQGVQLQAPASTLTPGSYAITASQGTAANYILDYVDGTLVVKPSPSVKAENLINTVGSATGTSGTTGTSSPPTTEPTPAPGSTPGGTAPVTLATVPPGQLLVVNGGVSTPVVNGTSPAPAGQAAGASSGTGAAAGGVTSQAQTAPVTRLVTVREQEVVQALPGQPLSIGVSGAFQQPEGTRVTFVARQQDGRPLPAWMTFDAATGTLGGTPPAGLSGVVIDVVIEARTPSGDTASSHLKVELGRGQSPSQRDQ